MKDGSIFDGPDRQEHRSGLRHHQGLIIQPGALGDCILTLPLAEFMLESLRLQSVDITGHSEYISIFPGRTCISKIRSLESIAFHRLFTEHRTFDLEDNDPLVGTFAPYAWIATFLGGDETDFERNLIFTSNCTSGTEVTSIELKAAPEMPCHIAEYYIRQFIERNKEHVEPEAIDLNRKLITPAESDLAVGKGILESAGLKAGGTVAIQPGSSGRRKNWPLESFVEVSSLLRKEGLGTAFLLGPAEMQTFGEAALERLAEAAPCLSGLILADVVGLLSASAGMVGNDSGITHLSAMMGVPTAAIFGPSSSPFYGPIGPRTKVFEALNPENTAENAVLAKSIAEWLSSVPGR